MSEAARYTPPEQPVAVPDPLRPWRREIPDVLANIPPTVKISTEAELLQAVQAVVTDHLVEVWRHAERVNSDLNLEVFGHLPEEIMRELQFTADLAAHFLATDATQDDFMTHQQRREFKGKNNELFGSAFKKVFEANRFRLSFCTGVISKLIQVRERLNPKSSMFNRNRPVYEIPRAAEITTAIDRMLELIGDMKTINSRYEKMLLVGTHEVQGKLDIVDAVSVASESYIALITAGPRAGEKLPTPQSPTSQDS
ncbi:hypothetical protein K2Y00_01870 [Patescibacteria group bacterium]|nr:hypothetical protein [Patescibacteria group bacterium]